MGIPGISFLDCLGLIRVDFEEGTSANSSSRLLIVDFGLSTTVCTIRR